jgi:hypothetical protein
MIQRIQSVWLLLAALVNVGLFYFGLFTGDVIIDGLTVGKKLVINDDLPLLLVALVTIILPAVAIFLFKNRKRQLSLSALAIIANIGFIALAVMRKADFINQLPPPTNPSYGLGIILPVVAIIFLFLAVSGIRKDQKLVKSLDRLR